MAGGESAGVWPVPRCGLLLVLASSRARADPSAGASSGLSRRRKMDTRRPSLVLTREEATSPWAFRHPRRGKQDSFSQAWQRTRKDCSVHRKDSVKSGFDVETGAGKDRHRTVGCSDE